jgi:hypothetical protein
MLLRIATGDETTINVVKLHKEIFALLLSKDDTFAIVTTTGSTLTATADFPSDAYKTSFEMRETKTHFTVAHAVHSTLTLAQFKRNNKDLLELLHANNAFIDLSATGSLVEIVLGPIFGIHPDNTSKHYLQKDLKMLACINTKWAQGPETLRLEAKKKLDFIDYVPAFQLQTRRIRRTIKGVDYSVKAVCFICAAEHRDLWEEILVTGATDGWLATLGRFYLIRRNDTTEDLRLAMCWHNKTINALKAIVIRGISKMEMDSGIKHPHHCDQRPTVREKLSTSGFVTIVSSNEDGKWIGISTTPEDSKLFINTIMRDICRAAFMGGHIPKPTADEPVRPDRTSQPKQSDARSVLFDKQSKSWADIAKDETGDDTTTHTETNIARRPPRFVKFQSRIRFEDNDEATKLSAADSATAVTAITQNDLKSFADSLRSEIREEFKSTYSDLSSHTGLHSTQQSILATLQTLSDERKHSHQERAAERQAARVAKEADRKTQLAEREEQTERMRTHTEQMNFSLQAMQQMMKTMQDIVQSSAARNHDSASDASSSVATYSKPPALPVSHLRTDGKDYNSSMDDEDPTKEDYFSPAEGDESNTEMDTQDNSPASSALRRSKRKQAASPDHKRVPKNTGRTGRGSLPGRGSLLGRGRGSNPGRSITTTNRPAPQGESKLNSPGGPV